MDESAEEGMRWADCEDDEGEKNKEEQETEEVGCKKEQEAESKKEQEAGEKVRARARRKKECWKRREQQEGARLMREMTDEKPPGVEEVESELETQDEEQRQVESKQEAQGKEGNVQEERRESRPRKGTIEKEITKVALKRRRESFR